MANPDGGVTSERLAAAGLRFERDGGLVMLTLSHPERRNAQTPATWQAPADVGRSLDDDVRVVVVRADGPSFSAGLDLRMLRPEGVPGERSFADTASLDDGELERAISLAQDGFAWLRGPEIVSVAAVHGHAIGAGFQLALACDLRILADDAQLAMKEPAMGLVPDLGGTKPLVDIVGYSRALELCLTGRSTVAAEAAELGLAEVVVPPGDLDGTVQDLAAALLAVPSGAAIATKELLQGAARRSLPEQLAAEREAQRDRLRALFATVG